MARSGVRLFGVWQSALYSALLTTTGVPCEFDPNIDLIDPNLDAAMNRSVLQEFTRLHRSEGVAPFHFARPCLEVRAVGYLLIRTAAVAEIPLRFYPFHIHLRFLA
jgi:hypothetical protein